MTYKMFEEFPLNKANMKLLENEIRETFRGKILKIWERGFDATSKVRENLFFYEEVTEANAHKAAFDHMGIRVTTHLGYDALNLILSEDMGEPEPFVAYTARFESGDDAPIAVWLGAETLRIQNRHRPINAKVPIKELYISVVAMP